jgi:guanine deaminase
MSDQERFMRAALDLAMRNVRANGGRPFGAVVVRDGEIVASGINEILATGDPTAHAELQAIRSASRKLGSPRLDGCTIYASGQPCPMCLAAMHMTGVAGAYYAYSNEDGAPYGLSTEAVYAEMRKPLRNQSIRVEHLRVRPEGDDLYETWLQFARGNGAGPVPREA